MSIKAQCEPYVEDVWFVYLNNGAEHVTKAVDALLNESERPAIVQCPLLILIRNLFESGHVFEVDVFGPDGQAVAARNLQSPPAGHEVTGALDVEHMCVFDAADEGVHHVVVSFDRKEVARLPVKVIFANSRATFTVRGQPEVQPVEAQPASRPLLVAAGFLREPPRVPLLASAQIASTAKVEIDPRGSPDPNEPCVFLAAAMFRGSFNRHTLSCRLVDPNGTVVSESSGQTSVVRDTQFVWSIVNPLRFLPGRPGTYTVEYLLDGELVDRKPLNVVMVGGASN